MLVQIIWFTHCSDGQKTSCTSVAIDHQFGRTYLVVVELLVGVALTARPYLEQRPICGVATWNVQAFVAKDNNSTARESPFLRHVARTSLQRNDGPIKVGSS